MNGPATLWKGAPRAGISPRGRTRHAHRPIAILIGLVLVFSHADVAGQRATPAATNPLAHFLEQATLGPTAADVARVTSVGAAAWIDEQFLLPESLLPDNAEGNIVRNQLFLNMANAPDQLRQRMIFALSQLIVVSANRTGSGAELSPWVQLLSQNAFGNYGTLLREVTLSPTMGKYLDMAYSRKASATSSPNENYARELMQLFTIGLWDLHQNGTIKLDGQGQPMPSYSQNTISEVARALTGWTFPTKPGEQPRNSNPEYFVGNMEPRLQTHDTGAKTLLGGATVPANQTPEQDLDAVLSSVLNHPNVPPFVATRLIRSLVTSNPSPAYIERVANAFSNNGAGVRGDLKAVLKAVLLDPEAANFSADDGRLKDPILHVLGMVRALGVTVANPDGFNYVFSNLTERVLGSPTVFNFFSPLAALPGHTDLFGPEFQIYPPALAVQRANFIYNILSGGFASSFPVDLTPFTDVAASPPALVETVNQRLMFGRMSGELGELLVAATNAVPATDPRQRAIGALYLAAISSEFSVYASNANTGATTMQPPTGLAAASIAGNLVTLRWKPPLIGPAPTSYVLEGGVAPGQVLATIPTGSASPVFTVAVPPGAFYVRLRSVSAAGMSRASSEIRIYVGIETGPTAPANLLGMVKGSALGLSWRNTFGGGAPTSIVLDVAGAITASIPIGLTEAFTFSGVPPGTYRLSVRAINAAGTSGSSNSVTLTFPTNCSGSPQTPTNFFVARSGRVLSLSWQPSASGNAAMSYQVDVTGAVAGRFPLTARTIASPVPPGTYNVRVRAVNACGTSGYTAVQTVSVP